SPRSLLVLYCYAPPRSTLFPYTTLFRSAQVAEEQAPFAHCCGQHWFGATVGLLGAHLGHGEDHEDRGGDHHHHHHHVQVPDQQIDRKSTRLNSSHVSISYAVFCLKKEKI